MQMNATVKVRTKRYFAKSLDKNFDPVTSEGRGRGAKICLAMSSNQVTNV